MRDTRRKLRKFLADIAGVSDLEIWWTPEIPIVYINNAKAACSTMKHSLRLAQANEYLRIGMTFGPIAAHRDPHHSDDCLKKFNLPISACRQRFFISCVRNPYTRALSGYLDKVERRDPIICRRLGIHPARSFEEHLLNLADWRPKTVDYHFRPQHINLDFPSVTYDALFFLENLSAWSRFLSRYSPNFSVETYAPHSRSAASKLYDYYSDRALQLVQTIYDEDFSYFGYSRSLDDAVIAPGAFITGRQVVPSDEDASHILSRPRNAQPCRAIKSTLRFRKLIEMRLI